MFADKVADVIHHTDGRLPTQFLLSFGGIIAGFLPAGVTVYLHNRDAECLCNLQDRITGRRSQRVSITDSLLTCQNNPAREILNVSECAFLSSRIDGRKRFALEVLSLELRNDSGVFAFAALARTEGVVEITDGIRQAVPASIVVDQVNVRRLRERIGILVPAITF